MFKRFLKWFLVIAIALLIVAAFFYKRDLPLSYLTEKYSDSTSAFVRIEQMDVHYKDQGQGETILLLHGTASSLHTWQDWTKQLKENYRVISLDLPAFGLTGPFKEGDYSIAHYSNFLRQFVDSIGIKDFVIVGNSLGGHIALQFTLDHKDYVSKIVLLNSSGLASDRKRPLIFSLAQHELSAALLKNILPRSVVKGNLEAVYYNDSLISAELIDRYYEFALGPGNRQAFIDRAKSKTSSLNNLDQIDQKTLIMWGKYDEWISVENAKKFHKKLKHSSLIIFDNAGHVPMEEIPNETVKRFKEFIETN